MVEIKLQVTKIVFDLSGVVMTLTPQDVSGSDYSYNASGTIKLETQRPPFLGIAQILTLEVPHDRYHNERGE